MNILSTSNIIIFCIIFIIILIILYCIIFKSNFTTSIINEIDNKSYNISDYTYIHIPKTAGTSIEKFGLTINIKWGAKNNLLYKKYFTHFTHSNWWHIPMYYYHPEVMKKIKIFTTVRNPYSRIISEINYFIKNGKIEYSIKNCNDRLHEILSNIYISDKNNNKILNKEFLSKFTINDAWHCVPMYHYVCERNNNKICKNVKILKVENLNNDMNNFLKKFNIKNKFDSIENTSTKNFKYDQISSDNLKLINKIYKNDFKLFGYNMMNLK